MSTEQYLYLECECSDTGCMGRIYRDNDPEWDTVSINVQLNPYLPWYRRVVEAFKYVFNMQGQKCHWGDILIPANRRQEVADFIVGR